MTEWAKIHRNRQKMCCSSLIFCIFLDWIQWKVTDQSTNTKSYKTVRAFVSCTKGHFEKAKLHSETCGWNKSGKCSSFVFFFFLKFHIYKVVGHNLNENYSVKHLLAGIALKAASCMLNMLQLHFLHLKQCWENRSRRASHLCLQPPESGPSCLCLIHEQPGEKRTSWFNKWTCLRPK